jgi:aminoglycoside phosphotransferase (APT) family kinase protein
VLSPEGTVRAVLDWELCTLGDPLADLGLLMVYWTRPDDGGPVMATGHATSLDGFLEREELLERYSSLTGSAVSDIDYFIALGYWKLACILEGIYTRYAAGVMGDDGVMDANRFAEQAVELGQAAMRITERFATSRPSAKTRRNG